MAEPKTPSAGTAAADATPPRPDPFARPELQPVPHTLTVRLAKGSRTVGDLVRLEPGDLVPLATPVGEPSLLLAGGAVIASGELVEIKGKLEFRVTSVGRPERD